jgi:ribosome-associated translation inhibitor RaiA
MKLEPQVTFKNVAPSDAVLERIQSHLDRLDQKVAGVTSCRVVFERPQQRNHKDERYRVGLVLTLPGGIEIAVNHDPQPDRSQDPEGAVREAFEMAERRLIDAASRQHEGHRHRRPGVFEWEQS